MLHKFSGQSITYILQSYYNIAAAKLLCGTHAPPLLKQLHWLPVLSRIQFKLCTLMFDIYHGTAPQYLSELVRLCDDTRLRSNVRGNFVVSRTRLHVTNKAFPSLGHVPGMHCRLTLNSSQLVPASARGSRLTILVAFSLHF